MMSDKDKLYMAAAGIPVGAGAYYGGHRLHKWMDRQPLFGDELRDLADRFVATGKLPAMNRAPAYAELGSEIAQAPVLQSKAGPMLGGEFIQGLREGLPGRAAGVKPLEGALLDHYSEFAKGPREAYAQLGREMFGGPEGFATAYHDDIVRSLRSTRRNPANFDRAVQYAQEALPHASEDALRKLLQAELAINVDTPIPNTVAELLEGLPSDKKLTAAMYESADPLVQYANLKMAPRISNIAEGYGSAFDALKKTRAPLRGAGTALKGLGLGGAALGTLAGANYLLNRE
jgi:hypothetical protein